VCLGLRWTAKKRVGSSFCVPRCTQCLKLPAKTIQTCILLTADQVARRGRPRALATCLTSNPPLSNSRNSDRETRTGDKVSSISPHFTPKSKQIDRTLCLTSPNLHPKTQPNLKSSPQSSPYPESLKIHAPQQTLFPPPSTCHFPMRCSAFCRGHDQGTRDGCSVTVADTHPGHPGMQAVKAGWSAWWRYVCVSG
jgi:hypothetical protein